MTKRLSSIAIILFAAVFITAGFIEMNENMSGLDDNAFKAFAALNTENCQNAPAIVVRTVANMLATLTDAGTNPGNTATYQQPTGAPTQVANYGAGGTLAGIVTAINAVYTNLPGSFTPLTVPERITVPIAGNAGKITGVMTQSFTSANFAGTTPDSLTLYKLAGGVAGAWTALTYVTGNPAITEPTDGTWAMFRDNGAGAAGTFIPAGTAMLGVGTNYYIVTYVQDGGTFDLDQAADAVVTDPAVLGVGIGGGAGSGSSDDDNGCVYNPMATLSLEWLLLLLAPVAMIFRRRK